MIEFKLPSLGADMDEGTLLSWHVKPGDAVKRGQVVAVVDTSKAAVDVEIWQDGVVAELLVHAGEKVPVGTALATLLAPGEVAAPAGAPAPGSGPLAAPAAPPQPVTPQVQEAQPTSMTARHPVSPAARKRAKELGLDPDNMKGSGTQGAVTLADIEAAAAGRVTPAPAASTPDRQKEMRKAIAAAMSRSKREIPHYYLSDTIPMAAAIAWLQQRNEGVAITGRMLPAVLLLHAVAVALRRVPQLNGFYRDGAFQPSRAVHAGVAISLRGGGLVAPALHDVGDKPLAQLMHELGDLVRRARAGSLRSSEMSDPTITVTNLGDQSVETVFGVIYPPQVALVGFGSLAVRPWVQDGKVCALPLLTATLAADHRASDGHQGALFLAELRDLLQQPQILAENIAPAANQEGTGT
ncbi:MAG: dihydrolipoamide acetyltransferase family protein [Polaromonas sp.]|uniref:dihydrolipoamide acetyltransferase family protein n=1 Tax=Polaromonas sp. TaxID=1869339 RepID=UPI0024890125|nr:dihydrolipoamide acetyltransferase family protein [Polaromonas sp.]MDI1268498.1 dihydrolipoamide acetyltransferase family protein [Polaromonas sp.]